MKLFVGLGNSGPAYAGHRHNIGYRAADAIAASHSFPAWRGKFQGQIAEGRLGSEKVLLIKPETYMNLSGDSVRAAVNFYKLDPAEVVVFHDELDLAPGRVRVKTGGGTAGHNGLRSIAAHLGPDFQRVRLGIGHPGDKRLVSNYVLGNFAKDDEAWLSPLLDALAHAAPLLATGDQAGFTNRLAQARPDEPKPEPVSAPSLTPTEPEPAKTPLQRLIERFR